MSARAGADLSDWRTDAAVHEGPAPSAAQRTVLNAAIADELRLRLASPNRDLGPGPYDQVELEAFACECAADGCRERIRISLRRFERLRAAGYCVVAPGHRITPGEAVVSRQEGFWVIGLGYPDSCMPARDPGGAHRDLRG